MRPLLIFLITTFILASPAPASDVLKPYRVTFRTTDCSGATGMASVEVDRIEKVQDIACPPEKGGHSLKQVLARNQDKSMGYEAFTVTAEEAGRIEKQISEYMESRKKALEGGKTLIIEQQ